MRAIDRESGNDNGGRIVLVHSGANAAQLRIEWVVCEGELGCLQIVILRRRCDCDPPQQH